MRLLFISLLFSITIGVYAGNSGKRIVSDSVTVHLNAVKSIVYSGEWEPIDSFQFNKMMELIEFIENSPIDTVIAELQQSMDTTEVFFERPIYNIAEAENIEGYVRAWEINNSLINIEKQAVNDLPLESIMVPEEEFTGMYSKIPLITFGEMDRLLSDSIVTYPDSLLLLIANTTLAKSAQKAKETDSIVSAFLNKERLEYNNKIINQFRDSITLQYRLKFHEEYTTNLKRKYTDSIAEHNLMVLNTYNDSISILMNQHFKEEMKALVSYAHRLPNELTIYNYMNEETKLKLQNGGVSYQWVWLKNAQNDSIGLRVENLDKHRFRVLVDETVNLSRLTQRETLGVNKIEQSGEIEHKLRKVKLRKPELSPWKFMGKAYSGFTQTYINDYWSKGGKSSASALSTFSYDANYSKGKLKWVNGVDAKLGLIYYLPDEGVVTERNWHKNSDNVELNSRLGYSAFKKWYYSAEANFKTQFFLGFKNNNALLPNSSIFSPAYLTFSGGFEYKDSKKNFSAFLSPLSVKNTYVTNPEVDETVFGLIEGQTRRSRIGLTGKFEISKELTEGVLVKTKNSIFLNYGKNNDGEWQLVKIPDFDSETTINFKVNQFISTQVNFHFIYDKDVESKWTDNSGVEQKGTKLQVKEFLTLGISYKF